MGDMLLIVFIVFFPIGFFLYSKGKTRLFWGGLTLGILALLGGCEFYASKIDPDHHTISQWFALLPAGSQIAIVVCLVIAWTGLMLHLLWPLIQKTFKKNP